MIEDFDNCESENIIKEWCIIEDSIFEAKKESFENVKKLMLKQQKKLILTSYLCAKKAISHRILQYNVLHAFILELEQILPSFFNDPELNHGFYNKSLFSTREDDVLRDIIMSDNLDNFVFNTSSLDLKTTWIRIDKYSYHCIDFAALCGSVNIFKYLLITGGEFPKPLVDCAVQGGNEEIIQILEQEGVSFDYKYPIAAEYHHNAIAMWIYENYRNHNINFNSLIAWNNTSLFLILKEKTEIYNKYRLSDLIIAAMHNGNIPLYIYLLSTNIDKIDNNITSMITKTEHIYEHEYFISILNSFIHSERKK